MRLAALFAALFLAALPAFAGDKPVNINKEVASVSDGALEISRNHDHEARLSGDWELTSRA